MERIQDRWWARVHPRWVAWTGATLTLALLVGAAVAATVLWRDMVNETEADARRMVRLLSQHAVRTIEPVDQAMLAIKTELEKLGFDRQALPSSRVHDLIRPIASVGSQLLRVVVIDRAGHFVAASDQAHPHAELFGDDAWFQRLTKAPQPGLIVGEPQHDRHSDHVIVPLARVIFPVDKNKHGFNGAVLGVLDEGELQAFHARVGVAEGWKLALLREDGVALSGGDPQPHWLAAMAALGPDAPAAGSEEILVRHPTAARNLLVAIQRVGNWPLMAAVSVDTTFTTASWRRRVLAIASITLPAALSIILLTWLGFLATRRGHGLSQTLGITDSRYRSLVQSNPDGILVARDGRIEYANPTMLRLAAATEAADLIGRRVDEVLDGTGPYRRSDLFDSPSLPQVLKIEHTLRPLQGDPKDVETLIVAEPQDDHASLQIVVRDITERKRMQTELDAGRRKIEELALASEAAREGEKVRIARELHDELGQVLTVQLLDVEMLASDIGAASPRVRKRIDAMRDRIDAALEVVRRIAGDLRPLVLDDLGLAAALDWLLTQAKNRCGIAAELRIQGSAAGLPNQFATALFRIAQECLTNVMRHAGARHVEIDLDIAADTVLLRVRDDGRGIAPDAGRSGLGLRGIEERARLLGGEALIRPAEGGGTVVQVRLPVTRIARDAVGEYDG